MELVISEHIGRVHELPFQTTIGGTARARLFRTLSDALQLSSGDQVDFYRSLTSKDESIQYNESSVVFTDVSSIHFGITKAKRRSSGTSFATNVVRPFVDYLALLDANLHHGYFTSDTVFNA